MAKIEYKVSFVKVTDEGIERHTDILLEDISNEERQDIKSLVFLPINSQQVEDITDKLVGFPLLESIYLPYNLTTTMKQAKKNCPMLQSILVLTRQTIANSLDSQVVSVMAREIEGQETAKFRAFVSTEKDGKQTFYVTAKQVQAHDVEQVSDSVEMFTYRDANEYIDGENGLAQIIEDINAGIEDERIKIEVGPDTLHALLSVFVEKGITKNEFTIDFSKLYDKIESYKAISKSVNQVSTKEDVETNIVEAYQNVLKTHYFNRLKTISDKFLSLALATKEGEDEVLRSDYLQLLIPCIIDSPNFDDSYKEGNQVTEILSEMPSTICSFIKKSSDRALVGRHLRSVVDEMKGAVEDIKILIENYLNDSARMDDARREFCKILDYSEDNAKEKEIVDGYIEILLSKDFGRLTSLDVKNINKEIKRQVRDIENSEKEILDIVREVINDFPTEFELQNALISTVAKNGYVAFGETEEN